MINSLDTNSFQVKNKSQKDDYAIVSAKCLITNKDGIWYTKASPHLFHVLAEVLSQEFFRALIPHQPKSLFVKTPHKNEYHIYSEEIPKYQSLQTCLNSNLDFKSVEGLGHVLVSALFLMENDLHDENIGINHQNQFVKIDGGECLRYATEAHQKMKLSLEILQQLPFLNLGNYKISNWLDIICLGKAKLEPSPFLQQPLDKEKLQYEIAKGLLHICLLPPSFIEVMCNKCLSKFSTTGKLITILLERQAALKKIAKEGGYFKKINFDSPSILDFKKHLLSFKLQETEVVIDEHHESLFEKEFYAAILDLKPKVYPSIFERSARVFDNPRVLLPPVRF